VIGSSEDPWNRNYTPPDLAKAIVDWLDLQYGLEGKSALEPHVGMGGFADALLACGVAKLHANDIDPDAPFIRRLESESELLFSPCAITGTVKSFDDYAVQISTRFDFIVGNPPFSLTEEHIRIAISLLNSTGVLCYILPLHFHGSTGRRELFAKYCPTKIKTIRPRLSCFINGKPEMREMALFVWEERARC